MATYTSRKVTNVPIEGKWYNFSVYRYAYKDSLVVVHGPMKQKGKRSKNIVGKFTIEKGGNVRPVIEDNFFQRGFKDNDPSTWVDHLTLYEWYLRKVTKEISS